MSEILPIRTQIGQLTDKEKKAEYLRLGIKARLAEIRKGPNTLFRRIYIEYFKGSGLIPSDADSNPKSSWVLPIAPSSAHLAFLDHADEAAFSAPLTYKEQSPYWCYLVKHGWMEVRAFAGAKKSMININAAIWEEACRKATASQSKENVFLNPRGLAILANSLNWYLELTAPSDQVDDFRRTAHSPRPLKTVTENNYPIGPGFEQFLKEFKAWLAKATVEDLLPLLQYIETKESNNALIPWVLKYSPLAKTQSGLLLLIPLVSAPHDYDQSELVFRIKSLLANKFLSHKAKELLIDWALGQALQFQYDHQHSEIIREIFGDYTNSPPSLSSIQRARILLALKEKLAFADYDQYADTKQELRTLAMIPLASQDPEIRSALLDLNHDAIFCEMLYHATGQEWLDLAIRLDTSELEDIFESDFLKALKHASPYHLQSLRPKDLSPLLQSKKKAVRTIAIHLATLAAPARPTDPANSTHGRR